MYVPTLLATPTVCQRGVWLSGALLTKLRHGGQQPLGRTSLQHLNWLFLKLSSSRVLYIDLAFAIQCTSAVPRPLSLKSFDIVKTAVPFHCIQLLFSSLLSLTTLEGRCQNQKEHSIHSVASRWRKHFTKAYKSQKSRMCSLRTP